MSTAAAVSQPAATLVASTAPATSLTSKYEIINKIGEGTYGVVYLAVSRDATRKLFAIKTFKTGREGDGINSTAIREIMLLRELRHVNVVKLDSVHINRAEPSLSLAFDYAEYDLYEMIRYHRDKNSGPMDPYVVKSVMWQLINGLSYLHQNWIMHRDLKPSNVLVMGEGPEQGRVKIADFGLARIFQAPLRPLSDNGVVVTIWYRSPELLLGARHYTCAVDMWAAGCIFGELLMLRPLFQGSERKTAGAPFQTDQLDKIFRVMGHPNSRAWPDLEHLHHWHDNTDNIRVRKPEYPQTIRLTETIQDAMRVATDAMTHASGSGRNSTRASSLLPQTAISLMCGLLDYNPITRLTAEEALKHEYFTTDPLPGPDVFMMGSRQVATYPRRLKHAATPPLGDKSAAGAAGATGGAASNNPALSSRSGGPLGSQAPVNAAGFRDNRKRKDRPPGFR